MTLDDCWPEAGRVRASRAAAEGRFGDVARAPPGARSGASERGSGDGGRVEVTLVEAGGVGEDEVFLADAALGLEEAGEPAV